MKLEFDAIAEVLADAFGSSVNAESGGSVAEFGFPGLAVGDSSPTDKDLLVVGADAKRRVARAEDKLLVLAGEGWGAEWAKRRKCAYVLVPGASPEMVFATLVDVYASAIDWEISIEEALERGESLQELLDISQRSLGNPLLFYDNRLEEMTISIRTRTIGSWAPSRLRTGWS